MDIILKIQDSVFVENCSIWENKFYVTVTHS